MCCGGGSIEVRAAHCSPTCVCVCLCPPQRRHVNGSSAVRHRSACCAVGGRRGRGEMKKRKAGALAADCSHDVVFDGMCAQCGAKLATGAGGGGGGRPGGAPAPAPPPALRNKTFLRARDGGRLQVGLADSELDRMDARHRDALLAAREDLLGD